MKKGKTSKAWMREHVTDAWVQRARAEGYRSRAAYKLIEIDAKDRLLRPGMTVVDLGAAPGGWSQVAAQRVGRTGRVIGVDLLEMAPLAGVEFIRGDFSQSEVLRIVENLLGAQPAGLVISDMAPNISGVAATDQARVAYLAELALEFAAAYLREGGDLLVKVFHGAECEAIRARMRCAFGRVVVRKPKASRERSSEIYLLGRGRTGANP